jgi:hypothetical protein
MNALFVDGCVRYTRDGGQGNDQGNDFVGTDRRPSGSIGRFKEPPWI